MRKARVFFGKMEAGVLKEDENGYSFEYYDSYYNSNDAVPISLTMPFSKKIWQEKTMPSFFDGLIPEGWLLMHTVNHWKIDQRDRMGLLLAACENCIGAVSIRKYDD